MRQEMGVLRVLRDLVVVGDRMDLDFVEFHRKYPQVFEEIVKLCVRWRSRGREKWSINGAFEVLRWQQRLENLPGLEDYKLNNNYRSRYARMVNAVEGLEGIFEVRSLRVTKAPSPRR